MALRFIINHLNPSLEALQCFFRLKITPIFHHDRSDIRLCAPPCVTHRAEHVVLLPIEAQCTRTAHFFSTRFSTGVPFSLANVFSHKQIPPPFRSDNCEGIRKLHPHLYVREWKHFLISWSIRIVNRCGKTSFKKHFSSWLKLEEFYQGNIANWILLWFHFSV